MALVKMKDKGQVTIPASVRGLIDAATGDVFDVVVRDGNIVFMPQTVTARQAKPSRKGIDIGPWIGSGKGMFRSVDEIDAFVRSGRDAWD